MNGLTKEELDHLVKNDCLIEKEKYITCDTHTRYDIEHAGKHYFLTHEFWNEIKNIVFEDYEYSVSIHFQEQKSEFDKERLFCLPDKESQIQFLKEYFSTFSDTLKNDLDWRLNLDLEETFRGTLEMETFTNLEMIIHNLINNKLICTGTYEKNEPSFIGVESELKGRLNFLEYLKQEIALIESPEPNNQQNNIERPELKKKININCDLKIITTLFYELTRDYKTTSGKPYLDSSKADMIRLLLNNFTFEGKELSENTLNDYFNSSKPENRAKDADKIDILKLT